MSKPMTNEEIEALRGRLVDLSRDLCGTDADTAEDALALCDELLRLRETVRRVGEVRRDIGAAALATDSGVTKAALLFAGSELDNALAAAGDGEGDRDA